MELQTYINSTELADLNGVPIYMGDLVDAALRGRLNIFLQGDTGSGKTQLARDVQNYFPDSSLFLLGRNDMDTRDLFKRLNLGRLYSRPQFNLEPLVNPDSGEVEWFYWQPTDEGFKPRSLTNEQANKVRSKLESLAGTTENISELTGKINTNLFVTDELPNCVPAVRAQLFNLYDGFVEIDGRAYPLGQKIEAVHGDGSVETLLPGTSTRKIDQLRQQGAEIRSNTYTLGIATGNMGQQFTESANELGRALKDRMHLIIDVDYFQPRSIDTYDILSSDRNPRVGFGDSGLESKVDAIIEKHNALKSADVPFEKYVIANYLIHGLDYLAGGQSKIKLKSSWPNAVEGHEAGSDATLILPVSVRAAKSIITLSQALDQLSLEKGAESLDPLASMMTAFKFTSAYSGVLNEAAVRQLYTEDHYAAMDAVIESTVAQFRTQTGNIAAGLYMAQQGRKSKDILDAFSGRWAFMGDLLMGLADRNKSAKKKP